MVNQVTDKYGAQPEETPGILYKYRFFDPQGYHLKTISHSQLWFTSARAFNDPFDSILQFRFVDRPRGVQMKWALHFLKREYPNLNHKQRCKIARERLLEINKPGYIEWFKDDQVETNYNKFGICCLTPARDDLLMWAHYSDNHRGFCVGIDTAKLLELQHALALAEKKKHLLTLEKIIYSDEMPELNWYESMVSDHGKDDIIALLCTKSSHWCYEQEYRLIYWDHVDVSLDIGLDAIAEVVLGCRISQENRDKILRCLDDNDSGAVVYQAHRHDRLFALEFEQVR